MGSDCITSSYPVFGDLPHLVKISKGVAIQRLMAISVVEPFGVRILCQLNRLDASHLATIGLGPLRELADPRCICSGSCP